MKLPTTLSAEAQALLAPWAGPYGGDGDLVEAGHAVTVEAALVVPVVRGFLDAHLSPLAGSIGETP